MLLGMVSHTGGAKMLELSQGVRGEALEVRTDGVADFCDEEGNISIMQDVSSILAACHYQQGEDRFKGFRFAPTFRKVASIPVAVVDIAKAQGIDLLNDEAAMRQFLNDPDNRAFRTSLERV
jgi:hypothetical protein